MKPGVEVRFDASRPVSAPVVGMQVCAAHAVPLRGWEWLWARLRGRPGYVIVIDRMRPL